MFDNIIMNPPYERNLHLKVLDSIICRANEIVSIQPVRWLQDPLAPFKQGSEYKQFAKIRKHIDDIDVVDAGYSSKMFNANFHCDLAIYHLKNGSPPFDVSSLWKHQWFIDKVIMPVITGNIDSVFNYMDPVKVENNDSPFCKLSDIHGHLNQPDFYDFTTPDYSLSISCGDKQAGYTVWFNTWQESLNFHSSFFTKTYRFINYCIKTNVHVPWRYTPWLYDYTSKWDDHRLYDYFKLTNKEIDIIESIF